MLNTIKSIYHDYKCCAMNGLLSDHLNVESGVKQRCILSPLLFNMYVNDLVLQLQTLDRGDHVNDRTVSSLLYADDMVFIRW